MGVLEPIWRTRTETANRVRGRIEKVLGYALSQKWRSGDNPATWKGHLSNLLPARAKVAKVVHHKAIPWAAIAGVMTKLGASKGTAARCAAFLVLTAARSAEARQARWAEIDLENATWSIPAARMKGGLDHRVPLSPASLTILAEMKHLRHANSDFVFPGGKPRAPLSDVALSKALHTAAGTKAVTIHGCRSTFRDWCGETGITPSEVAEAALAHVNRDKTEAAYARSDLFERRRPLMTLWGEHCLAKPAPKTEPS